MEQEAMRLFLAILYVGLSLLAQSSSEYPGGWTKAKWGMKQPEVAALFEDARLYSWPEEAPNPRQILGVNNFLIGMDKFKVRFFFDKTDGELNLVQMDPEQADKRALILGGVKSRLLDGLTQKYGNPSVTQPKTDDYSTVYEWHWLLPTTLIDLYYSDAGRSGNSILGFQYQRRMKSEKL